MSRHANDGINLAPEPPPPSMVIAGNLAYVVVLSNTRTCASNPSLIIASAAPDTPSTRISGAEVYPLPGLRILKASIIHLTSLSDARFFL